MRVGVLEIGDRHQRAALFEQRHDDGIRRPHLESIEGRRGGLRPGLGIDMNVPAGVDAASGVETVLLAGVEVVNAVRGCGMHRAGAGVGGDVGGQHAQDGPLQKRMLESDPVEHGSFEAGDLFCGAELARLGHLPGQLRGDDVHGRSVVVSRSCLRQGWGARHLWWTCLKGHVLKIGMKGHCHRRG